MMKVCLALLLFFSAPLSAWAEERLTILHTSEHHGTLEPIENGPFKGLGGVARRAGLIERIRKEVTQILLVDSGDLVVGTAMSSVFRGAPDIAAMNLMRYDALNLGNHDFDFGIAHLNKLNKEARFPFLCTNLRPKKAGVCHPFIIKSVGRLRVGLLGIVGRKTYPDSFDRRAIAEAEFQDPIVAIRTVASQLRGRVDLLVVVTHQETGEDIALAETVPDIDVIIGGHTPGFDGLIVANGETPVEGRVSPLPRGAIFVKSHQQARTLGRLDLVYDKGLRAAEARNLVVDSTLPAAPKVAALVQNYARRLESATNRVLGKALVDLEGDRETVRTRESNFGNLLADLARAHVGAEVALLNSGIIRSGIPGGPVTLKRVMQALPYDESLMLVSFKLTGAEIQEAMENSVSEMARLSGRFLLVSGLSYVFDASAPAGARVKEIRVQGNPLARDRDYRVVVNRFIAEGGDAYTVFAQAKKERMEHQSIVRDLFISALEKAPVTAKEDGRIKQATGSTQ